MTADKKLWRNRKERKEWARRLQSEDPGLEVVHPHAAGIHYSESFWRDSKRKSRSLSPAQTRCVPASGPTQNQRERGHLDE
jgi:hypothetical protein